MMPTKDMYRYLAIKHATQRELESDKETQAEMEKETETVRRSSELSPLDCETGTELNETGYGQAETGTDRHRANSRQKYKACWGERDFSGFSFSFDFNELGKCCKCKDKTNTNS